MKYLNTWRLHTLQSRIKTAFVFCGLLAAAGPAAAAVATFPLQSGEAVATCASSSNPGSFVIGVIDLRNPAVNSPGMGTNWYAPMFHNEFPVTANTWNAANLGQLFGVALDDASPPNIYATATAVYGGGFGPAGSGGVYKLNGTSGAISNFAVLPAGAASLGNICYDAANKQFFVSHLDNGLIYRLNASGTVLGTFDHGVNGRTNQALAAIADSGGSGITQLGRRVWGLQVYSNRLYYAVWNEDVGAQSATLTNEIWSVGLSASSAPSGNFIVAPIGSGGARREISIAPLSSAANYSSPVADIAFSRTGKMMIAERTMYSNGGSFFTSAHQSRILEYVLSGPSWVPSGNTYRVGEYSVGNNSAGGVDYSCEGTIWATGDALRFPGYPTGNPQYSEYVYGLASPPSSGSSPTNNGTDSYFIDLDANVTTGDKTQIGDVEIYRDCKECMAVTRERIVCNTNGTYTYSLTVSNLFNGPVDYLAFVDLPPGVTMTPNPYPLPTTLTNGGSATISVTVTSPNTDGTNFCFRISAHTKDFQECCAIRHCITLPQCCGQIFKEKLEKVQGTTNNYTYSFTFLNLSTNAVQHLFLVPETNCFTFNPGVITLIPPLPQGGMTNLSFNVTINPGCGPQLCFRVALHDKDIKECCSFRHCFIIPQGVVVADPTGGLNVPQGQPIPVRVAVNPDLVPNPKSVRLLVDGKLHQEFSRPPYTSSLDNLAPGTHILTAEADGPTGELIRSLQSELNVIGGSAGQPLIEGTQRVGDQITFSLQTIKGEVCNIEYTDSLTPPVWRTLREVVGTGERVNISDTLTGSQQRYYRVRNP